MSMDYVTIVGASHAGLQAAASLRQEGFNGQITLIGDEAGLPYRRPPLSKGCLLGKTETEALQLQPPEWFERHRIVRVEARVGAIDRRTHHVELVSGGRFPYDHLVLATGARAHAPSMEGAALDGVFTLRTLADAHALRRKMRGARGAVVIGAGFIGLEFAAVATELGLAVHIVESGERAMMRALSPQMSDIVGAAHAGGGVELHFGQTVVRVLGERGSVVGVETSEGRRLPADLVVFCIGVVPNVVLAAETGLVVENGIRVNGLLTTSNSAISAIGDVANFPSVHSARPIRLESVQNAVDQARCVAARLAGNAMPFMALARFWSDQGSVKLQIAGLADGDDCAVQVGCARSRRLSVLRFRDERLIAVESCNRPEDHLAACKLLARAAELTPADASRNGFDLNEHEMATRKRG
ncbi:NAD(P)/FAD-dependent oxidoreductase [Burkholderia sp. MR1-5-21]